VVIIEKPAIIRCRENAIIMALIKMTRNRKMVKVFGMMAN
jgi:hypothetical protein